MSASGIVEIPYFPSSPDVVMGELPDATGAVSIELWDRNGNAVSLASSGCNQMGSTDAYGWPVSGLASLASVREPFHWRMVPVSGTSAPEGNIVLYTVEGQDGQMPSLRNPNSYIVQQP